MVETSLLLKGRDSELGEAECGFCLEGFINFPSEKQFRTSALNLLPLSALCVSADLLSPCGILPSVSSVDSPSAKRISLLHHNSKSQSKKL